MNFDIQLNLPAGWQKETDCYMDESGFEVTHAQAHFYNAAKKRDDALIDIYVGEMPEDSTAEDQAFSNYADIVGFEEDDPEDFNPIAKIKFNGKNAYGFSALCEDDSPMMFLSQEVKSGVLAIICAVAKTDEELQKVMQLVEKGFRVQTIE